MGKVPARDYNTTAHSQAPLLLTVAYSVQQNQGSSLETLGYTFSVLIKKLLEHCICCPPPKLRFWENWLQKVGKFGNPKYTTTDIAINGKPVQISTKLPIVTNTACQQKLPSLAIQSVWLQILPLMAS